MMVERYVANNTKLQNPIDTIKENLIGGRKSNLIMKAKTVKQYLRLPHR